ncbi:MAG: peptide deformylase [Campylobacterales bacterium]|nr:peptide deformylase [Campylobacterales bacterium]
MVREILIYPDKRLQIVSEEVEEFDAKLHALLDDMYETMIASNGVGLAAIQVGIAQRVLIINVPDEENNNAQPKENTLEVINPVFLLEEGTTTYQEGCLSVPNVYEDVKRFKHVKVAYQDRYGNKQIVESDDFLAIALQHEIEHLNGHVFIENLSFSKRKKFEKAWRKKHSL